MLLEEALHRFLQRPEVAPRVHGGVENIKSWQLNYASQKVRYAYDGAMLVGDAGSFVDPLTGGVIRNAMETARIAAQVAMEALDSGDTSYRMLSRYEARWQQAIGSRLRRRTRMARWILGSPLLAELVFVRLPRNDALRATG